ncbi:hypothetical protein PENTCL1PPCAC_18178, partial [Pristionchus entomophagus]
YLATFVPSRRVVVVLTFCQSNALLIAEVIMSKNAKFSKEDEALLDSYSNNVSAKGQAIFYLNALISTAAPVYLFLGINHMDLNETWIPLVFVSLASIYGIAFASKNFKYILKHKIVMKRAEAVTREINKKYADKKISTKEKEERILYRRNEVAEEESTYLAVFITNALFVSILFVLAFFFLANLNPIFNASVSMVGAAGVVAFLSTSKN